MQVSDQTSANMESESYQELSAASLRWQSTAIPIPAIRVAAYQMCRFDVEHEKQFRTVCRGQTMVTQEGKSWCMTL